MGRLTATGANVALAAAAVASLLGPASAGAELPAKATDRIETKVRSASPDRRQVKETYVSLRAPLPDSTGQHPAACDRIGYLRFRSAGGPKRSPNADAVIALIPGFLGGAADFDQVGRNTVRNAARRGRHIEVWALDRRSNCLEDHTGVHVAAREGDATIAWDYYWGSRELDGRRFDGFVGQSDASWLNDVGLEQTMNDWYTVVLEGLPRRRDRVRKLVCGGHSMGGPLTALFASWDFDGDPSTRRDAGFRQCAGLVGLDTRLRFASDDDGGLPISLSPSGILGLAFVATGSPYVNTPPITPETIQVPSVFGVGTFLEPQGTDLLRELPRTIGIDLAQRFLFSRDPAHFATQMPNIRDFTITNEATLAGVFDDNSAPLSFLRSSLGFLTGGPVVEKNFPTPDDTQALPEDPDTPLYSWQDYREVGRDGAAVPLNGSGEPFTYRNSEITDLRQFARIQFEAPANFIEQYFPTRLLRDLDDVGSGDRSGALAKIRYDGVAKRPALLINAADSDANTPDVDGPPFSGDPPNGRRRSKTILIPGYNHLDVATAARRQNDGRPEPSSMALWRFTRIVTG